MGVPRESKSWGETRLSLSQTWLLVSILAISSIAQDEKGKNCDHMIGDGHLQLLQQLVSVWPCPPCFLCSEDTEAGANGTKRGVAGREVGLCGLCLYRWSPSPTFSRSRPLTANQKPPLTPLQAWDRVGCQLVAQGNACQDSEVPQWDASSEGPAQPACCAQTLPPAPGFPNVTPAWQQALRQTWSAGSCLTPSLPYALTALALAPALGLGWPLTLAMEGPVPHSDWASSHQQFRM